MTLRFDRTTRHGRASLIALFAAVGIGFAATRSPATPPAAMAAPGQSSAAVAEGAKLFVGYNCADCHGAGGSGSMAPSLADGRFKFGGSSAEIFQSIAQGRPEGMPAWGTMIDARQIDALVAYVQSLSVGKDVSTENFTGATVERTGH